MSVPGAGTLKDHRELLNDLHHEIENRGRDTEEGQLFARAYASLLWFTIEYLTPDFDPVVTIEARQR